VFRCSRVPVFRCFPCSVVLVFRALFSLPSCRRAVLWCRRPVASCCRAGLLVGLVSVPAASRPRRNPLAIGHRGQVRRARCGARRQVRSRAWMNWYSRMSTSMFAKGRAEVKHTAGQLDLRCRREKRAAGSGLVDLRGGVRGCGCGRRPGGARTAGRETGCARVPERQLRHLAGGAPRSGSTGTERLPSPSRELTRVEPATTPGRGTSGNRREKHVVKQAPDQIEPVCRP